MKKIYLITQLLAIFLLLLTATNCKNEDLVSVKDGKFQTNLVFNVMQPVAKAGVAGDQVTRADILLFKDGKLEKRMKNITTFTTTSEGYTSVPVSVETAGARKAYVVANIDDDSWVDELEIGVTTFDDMVTFQTARLSKMSNPPFVMYGISEDISFGIAANSNVCPLYRAVARIDVKNTATNFNLHSARLLRSKVTSTIFPGSTTTDGEVKDFEAIEAVDSAVTLYSYENNAIDLKNATAVELTGDINGVSLVYTVPFVVDTKLVPIQRNYQYTIQVNKAQENKLNAEITVKPWKIGDDITHVVEGNTPTVEVIIDPTVGTYTAADSSFVVKAEGGRIIFDTKANAECGVRFDATNDWLTQGVESRAMSFISGRLVVDVAQNAVMAPRTGSIVIFNKLSGASKTFSVKQLAGESQVNKFMVLVVAGQSNASGFEASGFGPEDAIDPRVFQLSYGIRGAKNLDIIPLTADADDIDDYVQGTRDLKGVHLPLAQELLKKLPAGTKILVVPVSIGGTGFRTSAPLGEYDAVAMRPKVAMGSETYTRWASAGAYYRTLVDRTKYALNLNKANKLLGVVWCQGENDYNVPDMHYPLFFDMQKSYCNEINAAGLGSRTSFGTCDTRSWYAYSSTKFFTNWYSDRDATSVFSSYKQWNPNGFVHVPHNAPTNPEGLYGGDKHFGSGAYRNVIAPAVAQCMNDNGSLFNGVVSRNDRFNPTVTPTEANRDGGSFNDADIQDNLLRYLSCNKLPFRFDFGAGFVSRDGIALGDATGLRDINGAARARKVVKFSSPNSTMTFSSCASTGNQWSVSFMLKRTGNMGANMQNVFGSGASNSPFVGFRTYTRSQHTAGMTEFSVEPSYQRAGQWDKAVAGMLLNADRVRSLNDWVHYAITYDNMTKECILYMNGQEVQRHTFNGLDFSVLKDFSIGYISNELPGFQGEFMELYNWTKVISPATVKKLFLMGYYGFSK